MSASRWDNRPFQYNVVGKGISWVIARFFSPALETMSPLRGAYMRSTSSRGLSGVDAWDARALTASHFLSAARISGLSLRATTTASERDRGSGASARAFAVGSAKNATRAPMNLFRFMRHPFHVLAEALGGAVLDGHAAVVANGLHESREERGSLRGSQERPHVPEMPDDPPLLLRLQVRHAAHGGLQLLFIGLVVSQETAQAHPFVRQFELKGVQILLQDAFHGGELRLLILRQIHAVDPPVGAGNVQGRSGGLGREAV